MANLFDFLDSLDSLDSGVMVLVITCVYLIIIGVLWRSFSRQEVRINDLSKSIKWDMEEFARLDAQIKRENEAWLAARNENMVLRRENAKLHEFISRKRQFRLRNGYFCTEEQYMAELAGLNLSEQLGAVDANESANKQIEQFLKQ